MGGWCEEEDCNKEGGGGLCKEERRNERTKGRQAGRQEKVPWERPSVVVPYEVRAESERERGGEVDYALVPMNPLCFA